MKKFAASLALLLLTCIATYACPVNCSCADDTRSVEKRVADAKKAGAVIFYGRVLDIENKGDLEVTFAVHETWSPNISSRITVTTSDVGLCGYPFVESQDYLVVTNTFSDNKEPLIQLCGDTQNGFPADYKAALGPGYVSQSYATLWWKYGIASWLMTFAFLGLCHYKKPR